ncbi:MAG: NAD(P)/FAD-dependent oxidoreductase [Clostridiales bacterium]|nr:NAD(P)/FAD-dependent oxidoreductase [Clostridiales bacterium]
MYDVSIIGCGIIGSAIAYELSKYKLSTVIIEKENDVAMGATRANSAIIHAGYDPLPGTLMAKLNVRGNALCKELCEKLAVPYAQIGSLVLAFSDEEVDTLNELYDRGVKNGVPGMKILSYDEAKAIEPNIADNVKAALYAPSAGIVNPWEFALALAETAVRNGTEIMFNSPVESVNKKDGYYEIVCGDKTVTSKYVVNAAGVGALAIRDMVLPHSYDSLPSKGEYYLLDKSEGDRVSHVIFQCPTASGKGVLIAPTVHGNLIVGPNSVSCEEGDTSTSADDLAFVRNSALKSVPSTNFRANIRNFAGVRPNTSSNDYVIDCDDGFFEAAAIKSPGLASAPAIAEYVVDMMKQNGVELIEKDSFIDTRKHVRFKELSHEEREKIVKEDPLFGRVICRCETVTEGEIVEAIKAPITPYTVDGIKRRCGAGLGRCQSGFCGPRVLEILSRELGLPPEKIEKDKTGSYIVKKRRT